jgi:hypothetical protein
MIGWRHIVVEGFCLSQEDRPPCGNNGISPFCLENGHCPHLAYSKSDEREAAHYVPLDLILIDKTSAILDDWKWKLKWYLWLRWKKEPLMIDSLPTAVCPMWDKQLKKADNDFPKWLRKQK